MQTTQLIEFGSRILQNNGIATHRIDSEIILAHVLNQPRERILIEEKFVHEKERYKFESLISRRLRFEPVAYILKRTMEVNCKDQLAIAQEYKEWINCISASDFSKQEILVIDKSTFK